jgi:hypothetical protein
MFYLPVFVNQSRFHYCKLQSAEADPEPVELSFVVQKESGHGVELLRIKKDSYFLSAMGYGADIRISATTVNLRSQLHPGDIRDLEVRISPRESKDGTFDAAAANEGFKSTEPMAEGFAWKEDRGDIFLNYQGIASGTIRIIVVLEPTEGKAYSGSFLLHTGPAKSIFDTVFDFGSEASQIAVHQRGTDPLPEPRINLVDRLIFDFYAPAVNRGQLTRHPYKADEPPISISNVDRPRFMAYDQAHDGMVNNEFFNSSFFVLRSYHCQPGDAPGNPQSAPFSEGDNEWVSLLGDTYDDRYINPKSDRDYEIVPNLKLAELRISRDFPLCINGRYASFSKERVQTSVFRRVMCEFLHLLLKEIEEDHPDQHKKLLKLTVLVPNIYSQLRVSALIRNLYEDLRTIIREQEYGFSGVEVQTLSESDAALLGLVTDPGIGGLDHDTLKKGNHCLVIDSGKGTTDISVLSAGGGGRYSSIFRSGFAGAGNALTYAFADTLFASIVGPENKSRREQFLKMFLDDQGDLGARYIFHRGLEAVKKNYGKRADKGYTYDLEEFRKIFKDIQPDKERLVLGQKLQGQFAKPGKTFQDYFGIVSATIDMLVSKAVKQVKEARIQNFEVVVFSGRSFLMDDYRERLQTALKAEFNIGTVIFRPDNLKRSCLLGPLNHPQGTNYNSDLIGTPVFSKSPGPVKRLFKFVGAGKGKPDKRHDAEDLNLEDFYLVGVDFDREKQSLSICGKQPILRGLPPDEMVNLAYVGENFLLRTEHDGIEANFVHSTGSTMRTDPLAWMSQFPHVSGPGHITPAKIVAPPTPPAAVPPPAAADAPSPESKPMPPQNPPPAAGTVSSPYPNDDMWDYI